MTGSRKESLTETWIRKAKNNPLIAFLIIVSLTVIGVSAFTESATKLYKILFSTQETQISSYTVEIRSLPATANQEAHPKPHQLILELHDKNDVQQLVTLNYPMSRLFEWSPKTSRDVVLSISIGNITLKKIYPGNLGFPEFLRDFHTGNRIFRPNEFSPNEGKTLKKYGVEFISVAFNIRGAESVIKKLSK